ncbi:hypothetical protein CCAX7_54660 [Capsulimonas corticalis]|uniref:Uncharacterized protein n=1 Tax=Capsulimonas corticalis TaxID=2219043 RepID=A0A402D5R5_9BACT|nr:hypothetical protein [Capsulimonas corticalis]BDI33415.1 hypothetical protein CCAX7_54660 [Capsulimonas corticalis]
MALTEQEVAEINSLLAESGKRAARKIFLEVEAKRLLEESMAANEELNNLRFDYCPAQQRINEILRDASIRESACPGEVPGRVVENAIACGDDNQALAEDERPLNRYAVDYEFGAAKFYTRSIDIDEARLEFYDCANECFGIRKSIGDVKINLEAENVHLPVQDAKQISYFTHALLYGQTSGIGDEVIFDRRYKTASGEGWKLQNESGERCTCATRGSAELACEVHHFWVENHNHVCPCTNPSWEAPHK